MQDNSSRNFFLLLIMASNQPPDHSSNQLPNTLPQQQTIPPTSMLWHGVPILWQGNGYGFPPFPFAFSPYLPPYLQKPLNSPYLPCQWLGPLSSPYPPPQFLGLTFIIQQFQCMEEIDQWLYVNHI